ncbi:VIT1/CCC1 transporter family protein [Aquipuribacter hungaricus]|uniref:VIT family protein n=1 Tax=Aquipuribacter hungaricus TaxID=545624 RepID=A0ABV7WCY4_9MICO
MSDARQDLAGEPHDRAGTAARLNWLRAGVLGANDGIVSTAGLVIGVAGATSANGPLLTAGVAGLVAGAVSMALGEYVSVSSSRDSERSLLDRKRRAIATSPQAECRELAQIYQAKGLSADTAWRAARELTTNDAFAAHADAELGIDPHALVSPWNAAAASALSFSLGALLPLASILLLPPAIRIWATFVVVLLALALAGALGATIGGAGRTRAVIRIVVGGGAGMAFTYLIGSLLGTTL